MTTLIITILAILYIQGFNEWCKKDFLRTWNYSKTSIDFWDKTVGYGLCLAMFFYPVSIIAICIMSVISVIIESVITCFYKAK